MPETRALTQLAVLASVTIFSACVVYGVYRHRQRNVQQARTSSKTKTTSLRVEHHDHVTTTTTSTTQHVEASATESSEDQHEDAAKIAALSGQEAAVQATKLYKAGQFADAIEMYSLAIEQTEKTVPLDTRNLKVMFSNRAAACERIGNHQQVINDCSSALAIDNRHAKAYSRRAKAKTAIGDLRGALVDYVCLLVLSEAKQEQLDETLATEITRIHTDITAKEVEDARKKLTNGTRFLPDAFFITSYYATFHNSDDESDLVANEPANAYTAQLNALDKSDDTRSVRGELLTKRALAYREAKKYEDAAADFEAALAILQPEDSAYYTANVEGGTYHHLKGDFDSARKCFEAAHKVKPQSLFAKIRLGGLCFDLKDREHALQWFEKALADKPECATAFFHRGQLHSIDQDEATAAASVAAACKDLEHCIELAPDFAMAHIQLGVTSARTGDFDAALQHLKTAAKIAPELPEIYNYMGETYLQKAQMAQSGADLKTAEEMFDKTIALDPSYPMAYINKGSLLVSMGGDAGMEALGLFETAVQKCPRSKFAYCHLAQVYIAMQEYARAIEHIDTAISFAFAPDELTELLGIRVTAQTHQQAHQLLQLQ